MKHTAKKVLCLALALVLVLALAACAKTPTSSTAPTPSQGTTSQTESKLPEWLNLDGYHPIVKKGTDKSISFTIFVGSDYSNDWQNRYYWKAMEQILNIRCDVTQVLSSAAADTISTMFASDTLKDVTLGSRLTPDQQVLYGQTEKQLVNLKEYFSEELTPAIAAIFKEYPHIEAGLTLPDGGIYAFPYITEIKNPSNYTKRQIRKTWMEEQKLEMPKTLDELTKVLQAFKKAYPDSIPMGGGFAYANPSSIILNALGVITTDSKGEAAAVRNGEIIIPAGDKEVWTAYVKTMAQYYAEGLISQDFYTLDNTQASAEATAGKYGIIGELDPFVVCPAEAMFQQYTCLAPLTSELCSKAFAAKNCNYSNGGCFMSVKAENKELIMRWADWMLTSEGTNAAWVGANKNDKEMMLDGYGGWYVNDQYSRVDVERVDVAGGTDKYPNAVIYLRSKVAGFDMGSLGTTIGENVYRQKLSGLKILDYYDQYKLSTDNGDFYWRVSTMEQLDPVQISCLPQAFFDEETSDKITELSTALNDYIENQTALFVTGKQSLDKLDDYFKGLEERGFSDYLKYYQEAYAEAVKSYK